MEVNEAYEVGRPVSLGFFAKTATRGDKFLGPDNVPQTFWGVNDIYGIDVKHENRQWKVAARDDNGEKLLDKDGRPVLVYPSRIIPWSPVVLVRPVPREYEPPGPSQGVGRVVDEEGVEASRVADG